MDETAEHVSTVSLSPIIYGNKTIEVCRFNNLPGYYSFEPHRHKFDLVIWSIRGIGVQSIDHAVYEMPPGRLFFVRQGQLHQIQECAEDGWMIILNEEALRNLNASLLDNFYQRPYLDLKELSCETFMGLFSLLQLEMRKSAPGMMMVTHLLNGMLMCAEQRSSFLRVIGGGDDRFAVIRRLKSLIEKEYKRHKDPDFYYDAMALSGRRINAITKSVLGRTVYELVQERLLLESKSLLNTTRLSVKEIAAELEFNSQGYFCRFFKKMTGITALDYRVSSQVRN